MEYIAPTLLSWVTCAHALFYDETKLDYTFRIIKMAVAYFVGDALYIALARKREYYMFIVHHVLAAYIGLCGYFEYINPYLLSLYFITFEFSNIFLNVWSLSRKLRHDSSNVLFPLMLCTYVPTRMFVLPITTYPVFMDSWMRGYYDLCFVYSLILGMSLYYSIILLKIAYKNLPKYKLDGVKFWSMFTYVFKLYISAYYMFVHNFYFFGIVDMIHIIISWLYNINDYDLEYQRLDIFLINTKIITSNITSAIVTGPNYYTLFINLLTFTYLISAYNTIDLNKYRNFYFLFYALNFFISVYNSVAKLDTMLFFWWFVFGGLIWALKVPERFVNTSFTSLPIMHVCIIIGDALFCESCLRFTKTIQ